MELPCDHSRLVIDPSSHAVRAGYTRPTVNDRVAATNPATKKPSSEVAVGIPNPETFPGPLVLPLDDLAEDPGYPPQSLRSWIRSKYRNPVTSERNVIYIASPPKDSQQIGTDDWKKPCISGVSAHRQMPRDYESTLPSTPKIDMKVLIEYIGAFFHPVPIRPLSKPLLAFAEWNDDYDDGGLESTDTLKTEFIGLQAGSELTRIRTRLPPDRVFSRQLNLDDILDAALNILPADAYALLMLVDQDMYETEDDDFCCGRAYGQSRIAVVSTARYNPLLDESSGVDREHMWPASHCNAYIEGLLQRSNSSSDGQKPKRPVFKKPPGFDVESGKFTTNLSTLNENDPPLRAAITNSKDYSSVSSKFLQNLFYLRVAKTVTHELLHCFALDHCVYYACIMQGTCSLAEDVRQPPYPCPVCDAKLSRAIESKDITRLKALKAFCGKVSKQGGFGALEAWIQGCIRETEGI